MPPSPTRPSVFPVSVPSPGSPRRSQGSCIAVSTSRFSKASIVAITHSAIGTPLAPREQVRV